MSDEPRQTIESGVPLPAPRTSAPSYRFDELEPGQRLVIEGRRASQVAPSVARAMRRHPDRRLVCRDLVPTDDDPRTGCAVWRTK